MSEPELQQAEQSMLSPNESIASALMRYLDANPSPNAGDVRIEQGGVVVLWKGEVPAGVRAVASADASVAVRFVDIPYSREELIAEARSVAERNGQTVASVGPNDSYSGLVVQQTVSAGARRTPPPTSAVPIEVIGVAAVKAASQDASTDPHPGGSFTERE